jgi:hypothetical protein
MPAMTKVLESQLGRRRFLRGGVVGAAGVAATTLAACVRELRQITLTHAEGHAGMYGMVNALIVQD